MFDTIMKICRGIKAFSVDAHLLNTSMQSEPIFNTIGLVLSILLCCLCGMQINVLVHCTHFHHPCSHMHVNLQTDLISCEPVVDELQNIYSLSNEHNDHKTKLNINLVKQCECVADSRTIVACISIHRNHCDVLIQRFNRLHCVCCFIYYKQVVCLNQFI